MSNEIASRDAENEEIGTELNLRQKRFIDEYLVDLNATQAAIRAGYSADSAGQLGYRLLKNVQICSEIERRCEERRKKLEQESFVDRHWVVAQLKNISQRCMQAEPITDGEGNPTGEYRFDSSGANRSVELLGKTLGIFTDKHQHTIEEKDVTKMTDEQLQAIATGKSAG